MKEYMKAAVYKKYGTADVLQVTNIEKPVAGKNELLVKVYATTVNRTDCARLTAKPFIMRFFTGLLTPTNPVPGTDFAGEIENVGKDVTNFKAGDRIFGFDDSGLSSQAGYLTIKSSRAIGKIPQGISYAQAAGSIEGAHYAYNFINKVQIRKGQEVLVNGATGAIGSAAVQLLRHAGAVLTATSDTKSIALVKRLGATNVIDYTKTDFTGTEQQFDFIFDAVGKSSFGKCKRILKTGGVYISSELGRGAQNLVFAVLKPLTGDKQVKFPLPLNPAKSLEVVRGLMEERKFLPVIDRAYELERIAEAYRYVSSGQKTGNVVVIVNGAMPDGMLTPTLSGE